MSSPGTNSVKVTYAGKQKRKRASVAADEKRLVSQRAAPLKRVLTKATSDNSDVEEQAVKPPPSKSKPKSTVKSEMKPPSFIPTTPGTKVKTPKKVNVPLPGPSPKRRREDDEGSVSGEPKAKKASLSKGHHRSTSSISSAARIMASDPVTGSPASVGTSSLKKPISKSRLAGTPSRREATPETDFNDNASIAESTMSIGGTKIRRTEPERVEYFKNQPECGEIEAHRALCTRCNKWVNLGKRQTYTVRPWEQHRTKCDQKVFETPSRNQTPSSTASAKALKSSPKLEPERRAILEADYRADVVEPNRILCKKCRKWTKSVEKYDVDSWRKHWETCSGPVPSSRVAAAERKIQIHNDPVATSLGPNDVKCSGCDEIIKLEGEGDYNLTAWEAHKTACDKAQALLKLKLRSRASVRASPSVASTEATIAVGENGPGSSSSPQSIGVKRRREDTDTMEESEGPAQPEERAAKIPRDESYVPPNKEAPGPFGWFLLPFQAFFKGFKESIQSATR